ncbi:hypothetical protein ABT063_02965 [Streptomyces sp. NPDC002838]|uniref:hypothetical protein n=1 Tax=Streptomyces sp. NPDC002838 TaxID=3154436 RepID=UPI003319058E
MVFAPITSDEFDPGGVGRLLTAEHRPGRPTRYVIEPLLRAGERRDGWTCP